jgi:uncharacterized protein (TIGR02266 family)
MHLYRSLSARLERLYSIVKTVLSRSLAVSTVTPQQARHATTSFKPGCVLPMNPYDMAVSMEALIVDANEASRVALMGWLERAHIGHRAVSSGRDALPLLGNPLLRVMIVDQLLSDMPVESLIQKARQQHSDRLIIVTADWLSESDYANLLRCGAAECVLRTEPGPTLATVLDVLLGRDSSEPLPESPLDARRESPRYEQVLPVGVRVSTWEKFEILYTGNISRGGVFIRSARPAPVGSAVSVRLGLPDGQVIELDGEVAHCRSPEDAARTGRRPGVGVRFTSWTPGQREELAKLAMRAATLGQPTDSFDVLQLRDADDPLGTNEK